MTLSLPEQARALAELVSMTRCKAGHDHSALTADHNAPAWLGLQLLGRTVLEAETVGDVSYPVEITEQRNCACGSTLGVTVDEHGNRIV